MFRIQKFNTAPAKIQRARTVESTHPMCRVGSQIIEYEVRIQNDIKLMKEKHAEELKVLAEKQRRAENHALTMKLVKPAVLQQFLPRSLIRTVRL